MISTASKQNKASTNTAYREHSQQRLSLFIYNLAFIVLLAAIAYIMIAINCIKFSRAEVFFAECTREMLKSDNIITPLYHSIPFFDKPILTYWLIALSYKFFGISHFASRIPSVLAALSTVTITGLVAYRSLNFKSGVLSALCLASSFMYISFATLCMSDMLLVLFDTITLSLLYASCHANKYRHCYLYLASLSMGLAFLTKGPIGIVLPGLFFVIYLTVSKNWTKLSIKHIAVSSIILVLACSPWFYAAFQENGIGALSYFFIRENLQRFAGSTYDSHRPVWFMLSAFTLGFLPWSICLPFALKKYISNFKSNAKVVPIELYLWLWLVTVIGFFSISRGKIDYYALPCYPAAAILAGKYLIELASNKESSVVKIISSCISILFLVTSIGFVFLASSSNLFDHLFQWIFIPIILFATFLLISKANKQKNYSQAFIFSGISILLLSSMIAHNFLPIIFRQQSVLNFCSNIKYSSNNTDICVYKTIENWIDEITYQTDKEPFKINDINSLIHFIKRPKPALIIVPQTILSELPKDIADKVKIVQEGPYTAHTLTVGYIFKNYNNIGKDRLALISN